VSPTGSGGRSISSWLRSRGWPAAIAARRIRPCLPAVFAALIALASCSRDDKRMPEIIGEINNEYLTTDEFIHHFKIRGGTALDGRARKQFKRWLLTELIDRKLLLQEARRRRIRPSREAAREEFEELGGKGWSRGARSLAWDVSDDVYEQKQIAEVLKTAVPRPSSPTDSEADGYVKRHKDEFRHSGQVKLRQIVVHSAAKVKKVKAKLAAGASFSDAAKRYSEAPEAARGGLVGWCGEADLPAVLWDAVKDAPKAGAIEPLSTAYGIHFLRVEGRREAGPTEPDVARTIAKRRIREIRARKALEAYTGDLRDSAAIKVDLKAVDSL